MTLSAAAIQKRDAWQGFQGTAGMTNPSRDLVLLGEWKLKKLSDGSASTLGTCIARPAWNGSGTAVGVVYLPRLVFPSLQQTLLSGGEPSFSAPLTWGDAAIWNGDGYYSGQQPGQPINYLDRDAYEWQSLTLRLGVNPDAYSDFDLIGTIHFTERPRVDANFIRARSDVPILDLSLPAYDKKTLGLGHGLDSDDGTLHVEAGNSDANVAAAEDFQLRVWFKVPATGSQAALWANRAVSTGADAGITLRLAGGGGLDVSVGDGSNEVTISDATVRDDDTLYCVMVWLDRSDDTLNGVVGEAHGTLAAFSTDGADASSLGAVAPELKFRTHERTDGGAALTGMVTDVYFATGEGIGYPADLRQQHFEGPASIRDVGAQYHYAYDEDNGTTVYNAYDPELEDVLDPPVVDIPMNTVIEGTASTREIDFGDNLDRNANTDNFTVIAWVRFTASGANQGIISKKQNTGTANAGYLLWLDSSERPRLHLSDGTDDGSITGDAIPADGVCRAIAFTNSGDDNEARIFVSDSSGTVFTQNGATLDTTGIGNMANALSLLFGEFGNGNNPMQGDVGAIHFYDAALTAAEMGKLAPIHPTKADHASLVAYWPIDEGSGTTINDAVGSVDGTLGAGGTWVSRNGTVTAGTATNGGWVPTLTGSPANGTAGVYMQQLYGEYEGVKGIRIDHTGHDHTADGGFANCIVEELHHGPDDCKSVDLVTEGGVVATLNTHYKVSSDAKRVFWDVSGGYPEGPLRYSGRGAKCDDDGNYTPKLGTILWALLIDNGHATSGEVPAPTGFVNEFPYRVAVVVKGGEERPDTLGAVLRRGLAGEDKAPGGLYWAPDLEGDDIYFGHALVDPDDYDADVTLTDTYIARNGIKSGEAVRRVHEVRVLHSRNWAPLSDSDISLGATTTNRRRFAREFSVAVATSTTVDAEDGRVITVKTPIARAAEARRWAAHLLGRLDGGYSIEVTLTRYWWEAALIRDGRARPDVVSVQSDYYPGLESATKFLLVGVGYDSPAVGSHLGVRWILWRPA